MEWDRKERERKRREVMEFRIIRTEGKVRD